MKLSVFESILDFIFDLIDIIQERKRTVQIVLSVFVLALSSAFTVTKAIPQVSDEELILAEVIDAEIAKEEEEKAKAHAAAEEKQAELAKIEIAKIAEKKEAEQYKNSLTEEFLQSIYSEVVTQGKPEICEEKLKYDQVDFCQDNYWNIQASLNKDDKICDKIKDKDLAEACVNANALSEDEKEAGKTLSFTEEDIKAESEKCLSQASEINQNVCWNTLYLNIAIAKADIYKCDNIKDENTKQTCKVKAQNAADLKTKDTAISKSMLKLCDDIQDASIKASCQEELNKNLLKLTPQCDETCLNKKVLEHAVAQLDVQTCSKSASREAKESCVNTVYDEKAFAAKDSRICNYISVEADKNTCYGKIDKTEDTNPEIKANLYKEEDRSIPEIGASISNPLLDTVEYFEKINYDTPSELSSVSASETSGTGFESVLNDYANEISSNDFSASLTVSEEDICNAYSSSDKKTACLDSLVLKEALSRKDINECVKIQDIETKDYCELSIVEADAMAAAKSAKSKCYLLSSNSAQEKCLSNLGFTSSTSSTNNIVSEELEIAKEECSIYEDPLLRLSCIREISEE